jgi:hypothetical protein
MPVKEKIERETTPLEANDLANEKSNRKYSVVKHILDIVMVAVILIPIVWLTCCDKLPGEAAAGLLGAIIGYVLSEFKKRVSN